MEDKYFEEWNPAVYWKRNQNKDKWQMLSSKELSHTEKTILLKYTVKSIDTVKSIGTAKCQHCYSYKLGNQTIQSEFISTDSPALSHRRNIFNYFESLQTWNLYVCKSFAGFGPSTRRWK